MAKNIKEIGKKRGKKWLKIEWDPCIKKFKLFRMYKINCIKS